MNDNLPVLDLETIDEAGARPIVVTYGPHVFGVKYYKTRIGPQTLIMFEESQAAAEDERRVEEAKRHLNARAKEKEQRDGLAPDVAMEKARAANPDLVAAIQPRVNTDQAASARELARLVGYLGLKAGGKLIEPTEAFFLGRDAEFHLALFKYILEDYARPTSEGQAVSITTSPATSSAPESMGGSQPATSSAAQPVGETAPSMFS